METAIGIILGAIATVLASHYYFRRTVNKSLGLFGLLNSFVFDGIAADVREQLHFRFKDREVKELQQLIFLVANNGERAIRDVIEPLKLTIPAEVEVLDASIVYRHPEGLRAEIRIDSHPPTGSEMSLEFPLLNKGEFFVVKMLLSGRLAINLLSFSVLSDDLPRALKISPIPPKALENTGYKFEWGLALAATIVLLFPAWICYFVYQLYGVRADLFPYPLTSYLFSVQSLVLLLPAAAFVLLFTLLGFSMMGASLFGGEFPPSRGPRFPVPKELLAAVFPYRVLRFECEFAEADAKELSNRRLEPPR